MTDFEEKLARMQQLAAMGLGKFTFDSTTEGSILVFMSVTGKVMSYMFDSEDRLVTPAEC